MTKIITTVKVPNAKNGDEMPICFTDENQPEGTLEFCINEDQNLKFAIDKVELLKVTEFFV